MTEDIENILERLPYRDWPDQEERLAHVLIDFPLPLNKVAEETDKFSERTIYKLRSQFKELSREERKQLVKHLAEFVDDGEAS